MCRAGKGRWRETGVAARTQGWVKRGQVLGHIRGRVGSRERCRNWEEHAGGRKKQEVMSGHSHLIRARAIRS
jgi:hypothetical protein